MTEQYGQQNINSPRTPRAVTPPAGIAATPLLADDSLVSIDTTNTGGAIEATLPRASEMPGAVIGVLAVTGLTNPIAPQIQAGDALVIPAALALLLPLNTDNSLMQLQSDGGTNWVLINVAK
jgi:hypothetical protein